MALVKGKEKRRRLHKRLRGKVRGSAERPRLSVNFSGQHIRVQIINDDEGRTLAALSTTEKALAREKLRPNVKSAEKVGRMIAERAKAKKIDKVVFDRGGFRYHGKVKALADAARAGGLEF
jgi:large subunit ribosomal protein L18